MWNFIAFTPLLCGFLPPPSLGPFLRAPGPVLTRQFVGLGIPAVAFVTVIIYPLFHHFYDFLTMGPANSPFVNPTSTPRFRFSIAWVCLCTLRNARVLPPFCFFWVLSSVKQMARLRPDKVDWILRHLQSWSRKQICTRRELESLIGSLHHAWSHFPSPHD
jgi:hypothetical protein